MFQYKYLKNQAGRKKLLSTSKENKTEFLVPVSFKG